MTVYTLHSFMYNVCAGICTHARILTPRQSESIIML